MIKLTNLLNEGTYYLYNQADKKYLEKGNSRGSSWVADKSKARTYLSKGEALRDAENWKGTKFWKHIMVRESFNESKSHPVQTFLDKVHKKTGLEAWGSTDGTATIPYKGDERKAKEIMKIAKEMGFTFTGKDKNTIAFRESVNVGNQMVGGKLEEVKIAKPISDLITHMVNDKVHQKTVKIKDEQKHKKFMKDAEPAVKAKLLRIDHSGDTMKITLGPEAQKMIGETINERQYSDTYFDSFTGAAEGALRIAKKQGYDVDEDDWFTKVATGGKYTRSRPSVGKTHSFSVGLTKNGKPVRKQLHFQVYGMESGNYELNAYIQ